MSEKMPNRSLVEKPSANFLGEGPSIRRSSEAVEALIDRESQNIIDEAYQAAREILANHRRELEAMAGLLLEKEKIDGQDIRRILGSEHTAKGDQQDESPLLTAVK
jgi:cell division protease FtsH